MNWVKTVKESSLPKVLLMLSGGKDSVACLTLLKENEMEVTAVHFVHAWGSEIPTMETKRVCQEFNVPLQIIDFSNILFQAIDG